MSELVESGFVDARTGARLLQQPRAMALEEALGAQNPSLFRPMKKSGIASLRMLGSGRGGSLVAAAG